MNITQSLFYVFSSVAILGATMVILSKNPVRAVLFLVLTFFSTAGLWMLLEAEFLSVILVLVYVGAVMVLFLFVVMMLDVELSTIREGFTRFLPLGFCISVLVILCLVYGVGSKYFGLNQIPSPTPHGIDYSNTVDLGVLLYTQYLYPFLLAGVLLLIAIISAISLTFRGSRDRKQGDPDLQIQARKENRIRLVNIENRNEKERN